MTSSQGVSFPLPQALLGSYIAALLRPIEESGHTLVSLQQIQPLSLYGQRGSNFCRMKGYNTKFY